MRGIKKDGELSVVDKLFGFKNQKESLGTNKEVRVAEADKGKRIAARTPVVPQGYKQNNNSGIRYEPDYRRDDRDVHIKSAQKVLQEYLADKIGSGGTVITAAKDGIKIKVARQSKVDENESYIRRARFAYNIDVDTGLTTRKLLASVEYDESLKDAGENPYKIAKQWLDADNLDRKIDATAKGLTEFVNSGVTRHQNASRHVVSSLNGEPTPYDMDRKLVIFDISDADIQSYKSLPVVSVKKSAALLAEEGFIVEKRVLGRDSGMPGPVYELHAIPGDYQKVLALLKEAKEWKQLPENVQEQKDLSDSNVKVDEGKAEQYLKNPESGKDDPSSFENRASEKNPTGSDNEDVDRKPKNDEKPNKDQFSNAECETTEKARDFPGRTQEKNESGIREHGDHNKVKEDESDKWADKQPTEDKPKEFQDRSLESPKAPWKPSQMLKYERLIYRAMRKAVLDRNGGLYDTMTDDLRKLVASGEKVPQEIFAQFKNNFQVIEISNGETYTEGNIPNSELADKISRARKISSQAENGKPTYFVVLDDLGNVTSVKNLTEEQKGQLETATPLPSPDERPLAGAPEDRELGGEGGIVPQTSRDLPGPDTMQPQSGPGRLAQLSPTPEQYRKAAKDGKLHCSACKTSLAASESFCPGCGGRISWAQADLVTPGAPAVDGSTFQKVPEIPKPGHDTSGGADTHRSLDKLDGMDGDHSEKATQDAPSTQFTSQSNSEGIQHAAQKDDKGDWWEEKKETKEHEEKETPEEEEKEHEKKEAAVGGSGGVVPNPAKPSIPGSPEGSGAPHDTSSSYDDKYDGMSSGKSDNNKADQNDQPDHKDVDPMPGVNINPSEPNITKKHQPMDGMSRDKSTPVPTEEAMKINPVKHMKACYDVLKDELKSNLSGASNHAKNPFRVYAQLAKKSHRDIRTAILDNWDKGNYGVPGDLKAADFMERNDQFVKEAECFGKKLYASMQKQGEKPEQYFKQKPGAVKDELVDKGRGKYHLNEDLGGLGSSKSWWDRALDEDENEWRSKSPDMKLREDEHTGGLDRGVEEKSTENSKLFPGRTREKNPHSEQKQHTGLDGVKLDEKPNVKEFHNMKDDDTEKPDNWFGRSRQKDNRDITDEDLKGPDIYKLGQKDDSKKKQYHERSYDKDRKDDIASDMPKQKMWFHQKETEPDLEKGRSDQPDDLKKDQRRQPTIDSVEMDEKFQSSKDKLAAQQKTNPWAVCTESVGRDDKEKYERCVQDVKKKNPDYEGHEKYDKKKGAGKSNCKSCRKQVAVSDLEEGKCPSCSSDKKKEDQPWSREWWGNDKKKDKKEAQVNTQKISEVESGAYAEQAQNVSWPVGAHDSDKNLDVTYAANDTIYDNTGRFGKKEPASPYSTEHIVEALMREMESGDNKSMEQAIMGTICGDRFKRLSRYQASELIRQARDLGWLVDLDKKEYKEVKSWLGDYTPKYINQTLNADKMSLPNNRRV